MAQVEGIAKQSKVMSTPYLGKLGPCDLQELHQCGPRMVHGYLHHIRMCLNSRGNTSEESQQPNSHA